MLLSKICVKLTTPDSVRQAAFAKAKSIKRRLDAGEDFAAVAKQYSEDPNAANGGDLGFISKGTLNELKFEEAVFSLNVGQTSDIIESRLGFHIVNIVAKKDQMVHVRQIFVSVTPPEAAMQRSMALLDSVRTAAKTPADFADAVRRLSTDAQIECAQRPRRAGCRCSPCPRPPAPRSTACPWAALQRPSAKATKSPCTGSTTG